MRRRCLVCLGLVAMLGTPAATQPPPPLLGFTAARSATQRELERTFDASLSPDNLRAWMKRMSARPHHVGSPYGKEVADFIAGLFKSWGYETSIAEYHVLLPTPVLRSVELVAPTTFTASLTEPALAEDATSGQAAEQLPVYNAYSIDGDVDGRARLRELRRARGLRRARASWHRRPREDRDRALRRILARHQAESRGGARRHRVPHLLRPARGRLLPGRDLSGRRVAQRAQRAARLGRRHAGLSRAIR